MLTADSISTCSSSQRDFNPSICLSGRWSSVETLKYPIFLIMFIRLSGDAAQTVRLNNVPFCSCRGLPEKYGNTRSILNLYFSFLRIIKQEKKL